METHRTPDELLILRVVSYESILRALLEDVDVSGLSLSLFKKKTGEACHSNLKIACRKVMHSLVLHVSSYLIHALSVFPPNVSSMGEILLKFSFL